MPDNKPRPLSLTDEQLTAILNAAAPLQICDREPFLRGIANLFAGRDQIGDGELGRAIREVQRLHFQAPELDHPPQQLLRKMKRAAG